MKMTIELLIKKLEQEIASKNHIIVLNVIPTMDRVIMTDKNISRYVSSIKKSVSIPNDEIRRMSGYELVNRLFDGFFGDILNDTREVMYIHLQDKMGCYESNGNLQYTISYTIE